MNFCSLAIRTDLIFARFAGELIDRGSYAVVRTPSNPGFHWGNFVIFQHPPSAGDLPLWQDIFRREFPYYQELHHMAFTWDSQEPGSPEEFVDWGFKLDAGKVLVATALRQPPHPNTDIDIRMVNSDSDWQAATENQIATVEVDYGPGYREFKTRQMQNYRAMQEQGLGQWYGAYLNGCLVADLGVYFEGEVGRFQSVGTHPDFRRRGICGTMVYEVAKLALCRATKLVMVADADYHAARIYESVGFEFVERDYQLSWWRGRVRNFCS